MKRILMFIFCSAALQSFAQQNQKITGKKPNIIVILADDLGYGSVGSYGATKVKTPNMDRIAKEGVLFTDANTPSSVCTPTRYSLMMGEYPWRNPKVGLRVKPEALLLPADRPNIASILQSEGYATGCVGKWHLGLGEEPVDWQNSLTPGPLERGFDYYFGFPINLNNEPVVYIENHQLIHPEDPLDKSGRSGAKKSRINLDTMTDVITGKAVSFIQENKDQPFFLYYATHQVHNPIHPAPRFEGTSEAGIYGDYIQDCDWSVGQILQTLDRLKLTENTLVIFTSDNGAIGWPAMYKGKEDGGKDGEFGFFRNAPWSGYKFGSEQGGSRVPFVARWPGNIKPGSKTDALISLTDFYATFRELLGQKDDGQGLDSVSFLGQLIPGQANKASVRDHVVYHAGKNEFLGIREKDWLLTFGGIPKNILNGKKGESSSGKLYHLAKDPKEKKDVYKQYPEIVQRMEKAMRKELAKNDSPFSVSNGQITESE
jgi:arylsulfatase A-like enzyme